jgi:hypothetical protein
MHTHTLFKAPLVFMTKLHFIYTTTGRFYIV